MLCYRRIIIKENMKKVFYDIRNSVLKYEIDHPCAVIRNTNRERLFIAYFCVVCGEYIGDLIINLHLVSCNCICKCLFRLKTTFVIAKYCVNRIYNYGGDKLLHQSIHTDDLFDDNKRRLFQSVLNYVIHKEKKHIPYEIMVIISQYIGIYVYE